MVLIIDNYDSFTYNLVQYFMQLGQEVRVFRNDAITVAEAEEMDFDYLVISPGPGGPEETGCSMDMLRRFVGVRPVLGVCLGHQTIGAFYGARIVRARKVMHGKIDLIHHDGKSVYSGLPDPLRVMRYHSLAIERDSLPDCLEVTAQSDDGEIMGVRHRELRVEGVQFHPESIGSEDGMRLLANFISGVREIPPVRTLLSRLAAGERLTREEAASLVGQTAEGRLSQAQIGAMLTAFSLRKPEVAEVSGIASALRARLPEFPLETERPVIDTCGTGGDGSGSFNVSTAAAFVAVGAGAAVAKHGNRSITSRSGSADVLEVLGVPVDLSPDAARTSIDRDGFAFLFAPHYHDAFKHIMGPRRELGFRTVFNMMGPLINPARVERQVVGVYSRELVPLVAEVLGTLGLKHVMVVHGSDGMDEITLTGPTWVSEYRNGWVRHYEIHPAEYGLPLCQAEAIRGGDAAANAGIINRVLEGERGPARDIVLLNAAAAILVADLASDYGEALVIASRSIDSGSALAALERARAGSLS
ncbi:MAG TPA: anthranilate phosphoribosyltransferase [Spirochaetota bacterium]|nr:anthranilate phosphoribosyltransferase [Spirochaetota bacterium]